MTWRPVIGLPGAEIVENAGGWRKIPGTGADHGAML
jgi:hypothetical protein